MTVIAGFTIEGHPMLVGDLLISGPNPSGNNVQIPTVGETSQYYDGLECTVLRLEQKIVVIGDNLIISWAGSRIAALTVLRDLVEYGKHSEITYEFLKDYLDNIENIIGSLDLSIVGHLLASPKVVYRVSCNHSVHMSNKLGEIRLSGSGQERLLEYLEQIPVYNSHVYGNLNEFEVAILNAIGLNAFLLQDELYQPSDVFMHSLNYYYGGGYEIGCFLGNKAIKIGDVSHVYWEAKIEGDNVIISMPLKIMKNYYIDDILYILSMEPKFKTQDDERAVGTLNKKLYLVPSLFRNVEKKDIENHKLPNLNSFWTSHNIIITFPDGRKRIDSQIYKHPKLDGPFRIEEDQEGFSFNFEPGFFEGIRASVLSIWERLNK